MRRLYRMHPVLPSLALAALFPVIACESQDGAGPGPATLSDADLARLQDAEAARYALQRRLREQRHIDALIGADQPDAGRR